MMTIVVVRDVVGADSDPRASNTTNGVLPERRGLIREIGPNDELWAVSSEKKNGDEPGDGRSVAPRRKEREEPAFPSLRGFISRGHRG